MNKVIRTALVFALAGAALLYTGCTTDYGNDIADLKNDVEALKAGTIADLQKTIADQATTINDLKAAVTAAQKAADDAQATADAAKTSAKKANDDIAVINGQIKDLQDALADYVTIAALNQTLNDYYKKSETYNRTEIDNKVAQALADAKADSQQKFETAKQAIDGNAAAIKELQDVTLPDLLAEAKAYSDDNLDAAKQYSDNNLDEAKNFSLATLETAKEYVDNKCDAKFLEIDGKLADLQADLTALEGQVNTNTADIAALQTQLQAALQMVQVVRDQLNNRIDAIGARIQSIVFVPEYEDGCADAITYTIGALKSTIISGTFKVTPATALKYITEDNSKLAIKEVKTRAGMIDDLFDIKIIKKDEALGRVTIECNAPELSSSSLFPGTATAPYTYYKIALCVAGYNYQPAATGAGMAPAAIATGNDVTTCFVGVKGDNKPLKDYFTMWDSAHADGQNVINREHYIDYTAPNSPINVFCTDPADNQSDPIVLKVEIKGDYLTLAEAEEYLQFPAGSLSPTADPAVIEYYKQCNPSATPVGTDPNPFAYTEDYVASKLAIEDPDAAAAEPLKAYVHYNTTYDQILKVQGEDINCTLGAYTEITKHQVPAETLAAFDIVWSYTHPIDAVIMDHEFTNNVLAKAYSDTADPGFKAGSEKLTKKGDDTAIPATITIDATNGAFTLTAGIEYAEEDVEYEYKYQYETDSDLYTFIIPFTVKHRVNDTAVVIDLGEIENDPTNGKDYDIESIFEAIAQSNEEIAYYIGDAVGKAAKDVYAAFVTDGTGELDFVTPSDIIATPALENTNIAALITMLHGPLNYTDPDDLSILKADAAALEFNREYTATAQYIVWGVKYTYTIKFKTAAPAFTLVLTPYDQFDPALDKTIIVEGDDVFDPTQYTLKQMYYSKYLQVQDQAGVPAVTDQNLSVEFTYNYEYNPDYLHIFATTDDPAAGVVNPDTDNVHVYSSYVASDNAVDYGYLDKTKTLEWGTYAGRNVFATAKLFDNGILVNGVEFTLHTERPIKIVTAGEITGLKRIAGNPLDVNVAQKMVIGGILSKNNGNSYYVANPAVFGYNDNNIDQATGAVDPFYQINVVYDFDNMKATLNGVNFQLHEGIDYTYAGNILTITEDNGKGDLVIKVPVKVEYYLDYLHKDALEDTITIRIKNL